MPTVTVEGPPIKDLDAKRSLTREITDALERAYKIPREAYVVVIRENPPENVCIGGELICDRIRRREGSWSKSHKVQRAGEGSVCKS